MLSQLFGGVRDPGSIRCRLRDEDVVRGLGGFFRFVGVTMDWSFLAFAFTVGGLVVVMTSFASGVVGRGFGDLELFVLVDDDVFFGSVSEKSSFLYAPGKFVIVVSIGVDKRISSFNSLVRMASVVPFAARPLSLQIFCISL